MSCLLPPFALTSCLNFQHHFIHLLDGKLMNMCCLSLRDRISTSPWGICTAPSAPCWQQQHIGLWNLIHFSQIEKTLHVSASLTHCPSQLSVFFLISENSVCSFTLVFMRLVLPQTQGVLCVCLGACVSTKHQVYCCIGCLWNCTDNPDRQTGLHLCVWCVLLFF